MDELKSLSFKNETLSDAVQNKFLSLIYEPYTWASSHGPVINKALNISNFPTIMSLMQNINGEYKCKMNSVLVSYYKNGSVNVRKHDDNE